MAIEDVVRTMLHELREIVKTETVVGEPVVTGDVTIIPVSKISFGFGAGGSQSEKDDGGSGTGGGGSVQPVAFIVIQKGKTQLLALDDKSMSIGDLLKYAPGLFEKIKAFKDKRKKNKEDGETDDEKKKK